MLTISLPPALLHRLNALANATGQSSSSLARDAIIEFVGDLEDLHLAEARARLNQKSIPLDDVERALGLYKRPASIA